MSVLAQYDPCGLTWRRVEDIGSIDPPGHILNYAVAHDSRRGRTVFFGGVNPITEEYQLDHTWEWDGFIWTRHDPPSHPEGRHSPAMAYDSRRGVCVLFGGGTNTFQNDIPFNDTWEWDGKSWTMRQANDPLAQDRPPPLDHPVLSYDSHRGRTVLTAYSARQNGEIVPLTSTWEWDGTNWVRFNKALARRASPMAYDPLRRVTVLFGGNGGWDGLLNDTWTWDGTNWTQVATEGPPRRDDHAMAFDERRGVIVMFGGVGEGANEYLSDTWEWDGTSWTLVPAANTLGIVPIRSHSMWYEPGQQRLMIYGGTYSAFTPGGIIYHVVLDDMFEARPPGRWIDFNFVGQPAWPENGTFQWPFNTLAEAVAAADPGCTLIFKQGVSAESLTLSKTLTLEAYNGPVTIGQPAPIP